MRGGCFSVCKPLLKKVAATISRGLCKLFLRPTVSHPRMMPKVTVTATGIQPIKTSTRSPPRHTSNHMSNMQCEKLVDLCREYYDIISDTGNSIESRTQRRRIWEFIATQLNEKGRTTFTAAQYKKKYQNLKTSLKAKMNALKRAHENPGSSGQSCNNNNNMKKKVSDASSLSPPMSSSAFNPTMSFSPIHNQLAFPSFFSPPAVSQPKLSLSEFLVAPTEATSSLGDVQAAYNAASAAAVAAAASASAIAPSAAPLQQQIYAPIPQMGLPLNLQSLVSLSSMVAEQSAAVAAATAAASAIHSPIPPPPGAQVPQQSVTPASGRSSSTLMSSPGAEMAETLGLADADPVDVFCMSLAESVARIRSANSLLYTQLKREISILVLETEIKLLTEQQDISI